MITIEFSSQFTKNYQKLAKNKIALKKVNKKIQFFTTNPQHPSLKLHKVKNTVIGEAFSFSVNGDLRIIFRWMGEKQVLFYTIGKHEDVYR